MAKIALFSGSSAVGASSFAPPAAADTRKGKEILIRLLDAVATWQERAAARRRLASFDDRMLHDIGIDRGTAETEAAKPFWRV